MRFRYFVCLALTLYSFNSFAQKAELELTAGPAMVSIRLSEGDIDNRKLKIAPLVGIGFRYHITNHWSAGVQFLYELKGVKDGGELLFPDSNLPPIKYEISTNLNYLTLPVMVRYSFGKKIQWFAGAGGYISHLLKAEQYVTVYDPNGKQNSDVTRFYNKMDAGVCMAIGVAFPLTEKFRLKGSLTESIGLIDIDQTIDPSTGKEFGQDLMTNSLSLQVGVSYVLGGK